MSPLHRPGAEWHGACWLTASVLVRGQGKTDGFYETRLPIPATARPRVLGPSPERDPLADLAKRGIEYAARMRNPVLKVAVFSYLEAGPDTVNFDRDAIDAWWLKMSRIFEDKWTAHYFPWLWSAAEEETAKLRDQAAISWALTLKAHALATLTEVEASLPAHSGRRYRAIVQGRGTFLRLLVSKDNFPFLKSPISEEESLHESYTTTR